MKHTTKDYKNTEIYIYIYICLLKKITTTVRCSIVNPISCEPAILAVCQNLQYKFRAFKILKIVHMFNKEKTQDHIKYL